MLFLTYYLIPNTFCHLQSSDKNDMVADIGKSIINIFRKSDDNYPALKQPLGFSQTPRKPQRNDEW
jgi:hypothetical protein